MPGDGGSQMMDSCSDSSAAEPQVNRRRSVPVRSLWQMIVFLEDDVGRSSS